MTLAPPQPKLLLNCDKARCWFSHVHYTVNVGKISSATMLFASLPLVLNILHTYLPSQFLFSSSSSLLVSPLSHTHLLLPLLAKRVQTGLPICISYTNSISKKRKPHINKKHMKKWPILLVIMET
jgi:hypothetical protein